MTKASWNVEVELDRRLLKLAIRGFFTVDDVAAFATAVRAAIVRLRPSLAGRPHVTICDTRGVQIQSAGAGAAFETMLANPEARSRRLAYVIDAALAQMQIKRITAREDAAYFRTYEEAEAWVFADDPGGSTSRIDRRDTMQPSCARGPHD